jgi:hypothetical protein
VLSSRVEFGRWTGFAGSRQGDHHSSDVAGGSGMRAFVVSAAIALLLNFAIPFVASRYGAAVKARFVERSKIIPGEDSDHASLDQPNLKHWILSNPRSAGGYACPVLFPLDYVFLFALGASLAFGSMFFARHAVLVSGLPCWIWWILPAVYVAADFVEDGLLIGFLKNPDWLTDERFSALARATSVKIKSVIAGICQLAALAVLAGVKAIL